VRRFVTLDLETVPDEALVQAVDGPGRRSYTERLERVVAGQRQRTGGRSDFLPLPYHRPVAACLLEAVEDGGLLEVVDVEGWTDGQGDEAAFLGRLWDRLDGATIVSFHGKGFDLPVLELRSLKLGVPAAAWFRGGRDGAPGAHLDVKELLAAPGRGGAASLDLYAKLVGLPGKVDVAGADVGQLYRSGQRDRIAAYCMTDVVQTWLLYLRFRLVEGTLSPDAWAESAALAREALPRLFERRLAPEEGGALEAFLERCAPYFGEKGRPARRRRAS
jgi:predicted PolB exonuclease-like 3'-5' exonuclease